MDLLLAVSGVVVAWICAPAQAQRSSCIEQSTRAQTEQYFIDDHGDPNSRLVTVGKPASGGELVYAISIRNPCARTAANLMIDQPVPEPGVYTNTTAKGDGTDRLFSEDGA